MSIVATIDKLKSRLAALGEAIASIPDRKREHAINALEGNGQAKKLIRDIEREEAKLQSERALAGLALEQAEREAEEERAQAEAEERAARRAEAQKVAARIAEAAGEIDGHATAMADALERRAGLIAQLKRLGFASDISNTLTRKRRVTAALWAAGIHRFAFLEHLPPGNHSALSEADAALLDGIGTERSEADRAREREEHAQRERRRQAEVAEGLRQSDIEVARAQLEDMKRRGTARDIWTSEKRVADLERSAPEAA